LRRGFILLTVFALLFIPVSCSHCSGSPRRHGVEEKLGSQVPGGLVFHDETGNPVTLERLIDRPTVLTLVYFSCGRVCPLLLGGLAETLGRLGLDPLKDYRVLTVSFDVKDTPQEALGKKKNYLPATGESFPGASWRFLTGSEDNIKKLTESVGFAFRKEKGGFSHPSVLVFLSPERRIVRYLYGRNFRPFDVRMALAEAGQKGPAFTAGNLLLFSYRYDDHENGYKFNLLKTLGTLLLFVLVSLGFFAMAARRRGMHKKA
jgi:protein SCO1/2